MAEGGEATFSKDVDAAPGPRRLPVLGNMTDIDSLHFHQTLENWAREHGPFYQFRMMNRRFLATARREDIASMLHERPQLWRRTQRTGRIIEEASPRGIFTAEGEAWRRQRKLVMHGLTPEVIRRFFPSLVAMTERLQRRWQAALGSGQQPNILRDLKAYALDVTIGIAMGQDLNTLEHEDNPLQRDIEFIFNRIARRLTSAVPYWRAFQLPVDRSASEANERIQATVAGFLAVARERMQADPGLREKPTNLLEALLAARDVPGSEFTDEDVIGNAVTMVFAGEDTTSNTIAWLVYMLAANPAAMQALCGEVDGALGSDTLPRDFSALDKLPWLDACTREAMRLKPVAPIMALEPTQDVQLGEWRVPQGMVVFLLLRHAFELDGQQERASEFLPERWCKEQGMNDPSRKLLPFGGGPRFCPGRYLAMTEVRMVAAMLARSFTLVHDAAAPAPDELFTFTMTPDRLPVLLRRRTL